MNRYWRPNPQRLVRRRGRVSNQSFPFQVAAALIVVLCYWKLRYALNQRQNPLQGNFVLLHPTTVTSNSLQDHIIAHPQTSQDLPRRNNSRNLCGRFSSAAAVSRRMPIVLSSPTGKLINHPCHSNAILYVVQKGKHSTYGRNSTALFLKSLDLLYQNYLAIDQHYDNVDVLIFHSGDYTQEDLNMIDQRYNSSVAFKLIDLADTDYWTIPESVQHDNFSRWVVYPQFSVGYRHMMRWYALKLYNFIRDFGQMDDGGCPQYQYVMRMDEDSFIHSPIPYDLFGFMQQYNYAYAFRMCAYELETDVWDDYVDHVKYCSGISGGSPLPPEIPYRPLHPELCGFYNNFFIIDMDFVLQPDVQHFLRWIDATGIIYRERYNDLQVQSLAVYAFAPPERIHRFLDWTYEHITRAKRCPVFGAIQSGYRDFNYKSVFSKYKEESMINTTKCRYRRKSLTESELSPSYAHLPSDAIWLNETMGRVLPRQSYRWRTFAAGLVELPDQGIHSG